MSERVVYHVTPGPDGRWHVKAEGEGRDSGRHATKQEAIDRARALAKSHRLAQVIIHKEDGTIQTEYTYGEDPHPPAG